MNKIFISPQWLYRNSFRLAKTIHDSGYVPDFIIMLMRGGASIGIIVHEYYRYKGINIDHESIKAASYSEIGKRQKVKFQGLEILDKLKNKKILVVDDILDSGRTVHALYSQIGKNNEVKLATLFYKPKNNKTSIVPDFFIEETGDWIVFPHELDGLSKKEIGLKLKM